MMPRGLAAAILAISFTPLILGAGTSTVPGYNLANDMQGIFMDVAFVVILGTAIITTIGVSVISHYEMKKIKNIDDDKTNKNRYFVLINIFNYSANSSWRSITISVRTSSNT